MYSIKKSKKQNKTKTGMDGRTVGAGIISLLIIDLFIISRSDILSLDLCKEKDRMFY